MPSADVLPSLAEGRAHPSESTAWCVPFLLLNVILALALPTSRQLATVHALGTLAVATLFALDPHRPARVVWAAGYIVGCDVVWRMTGAQVLHQFGKYALVWIFLVGLLRGMRFRNLLGPALYLVLLLPSIALVQRISSYDPGVLGSVSFNLSGPFALALSVAWCRQVSLTRPEMAGALWALAAGCVAAMVIAAQTTLGADDIAFTQESNFVTSGGYGPNQVSAMLGLGAVAVVLALTVAPVTRNLVVLGLGLILALTVQCLLTLSRGGIYAAVGSLLLALPFLLHARQDRGRVFVRAVALVVLLVLFVVPLLDDFTGGAMSARFGDKRLSGRGLLMLRDLSVWEENPIFGVGPGMSRLSRIGEFGVTLVHTEFTRMVAEHGVLGLLSFLILCRMMWVHMRWADPGVPRFVVVVLSAWSCLFMASVAFRLSAPALCLGLAAIQLESPRGPTTPEDPP